ncbi:hypothetical protein DL766_001901 [Monosporascus sp. MC13-8B]|nr:hypothetical protein DL763_009188 [Monosporascus cannonballus]RYP36661.1 hypothetical protein DL766_001901 [Monosporascus sp. MC13-8B]
MSAQPPPPPPPPRAGLSLYANLLDPKEDSGSSISRAPVVSQEALDAVKESEAAKRPSDHALRFQPHPQIRRPQQKTQKPKVGFPKVVPPPPPPATGANNATAPAPGAAAAASAPAPAPAQVKSALANWAPTEEDEYMYGTGEKRARGGRRKRRKKVDEMPVETDWDEIYDPSRPTNVDEYLRSDEKIREVREWKALLYKHRKRSPERRDSWDSEEEDHRPMNNQFAPPDAYSFAPPPMSPPRASVPEDKTGDDAYARRLAMSQGQAPPPPRSPSPPPPPPPPPPAQPAPADPSSLPPPPPPPEPEPDSATISRAPVRYEPPQPATTQPPAPAADSADPDAMDEDAYSPTAEEETPPQPTKRPGQKDFAKRLMSKYGWSKGQGLGAESTGILQPLRVQVEKRKKKPDSEGGGWAEPGGGRGRIIAPKTGTGSGPGAAAESREEGGRFGPLSNVIVLRHMLDGMQDLQAEMEAGLAQEIGEECGDKYGRVERLKIDVEGRRVYIKFTDQVSALRAVTALDGRVFAGNAIVPQFYDADKFERMIYE